MRAGRARLLGFGLTAVLVAAVATAALLGSARVAGALGAVLVGLGVALAVDLRTRTADLAHMLRLAARRQSHQTAAEDDLMAAVMAVRAELGDGDVARALGADGALEQMERRLLVAVETERLRAADRHRDTLEELHEATERLATAVAEVDRRAKGLRSRVVDGVTKTTRDERIFASIAA